MKPAVSFRHINRLTKTALVSTIASQTPTAPLSSPRPFTAAAVKMTSGTFKYLDPTTYDPHATEPFKKPWAKVDGPGTSFKLKDHNATVSNVRGHESEFSTDKSGFSIHRSPATEKAFVEDKLIRESYYPEVEALLKKELQGVKKVVFFDHTIRRQDPNSPRQPVQQVHVDQTPMAAAARVRRHLPADEAEQLLQGRYQIINVWRPISHPATDRPLAVVDWRSTSHSDFVKLDLLYPDREPTKTTDSDTSSNSSKPSVDSDDDRGHEKLPATTSYESTTGYTPKGETFGVAANPSHKFYYVKDMTPDEAMFIKCFDSRSEWMNVTGWADGCGGEGKGLKGIAHGTPHTAFIDPDTPGDAKGRESIEVRALVFYE